MLCAGKKLLDTTPPQSVLLAGMLTLLRRQPLCAGSYRGKTMGQKGAVFIPYAQVVWAGVGNVVNTKMKSA